VKRKQGKVCHVPVVETYVQGVAQGDKVFFQKSGGTNMCCIGHRIQETWGLLRHATQPFVRGIAPVRQRGPQVEGKKKNSFPKQSRIVGQNRTDKMWLWRGELIGEKNITRDRGLSQDPDGKKDKGDRSILTGGDLRRRCSRRHKTREVQNETSTEGGKKLRFLGKGRG